MLCRMIISGKRKTGAVPVYLNVYDLTPINGYAYWLGLGVYHSGVQVDQDRMISFGKFMDGSHRDFGRNYPSNKRGRLLVHGVEYAFGAHEHSTTGIFEVEPKQCPGFTFRKSILIGRTDMGAKEVRVFMEKLAEEYYGNTYNLITRNCNHFCNDVCLRLTGKPIPKWVNRLARLGFLCNCVLPASLNEMKVRHIRAEDRVYEKKKLRSHSNRFISSSDKPHLSSCSSKSARQKNTTHPPSSQ